MKWTKQQPNSNGLWLWRIHGKEGIGVLSIKGFVATELTVSPPIRYSLLDWWEMNKDIETYYVGVERDEIAEVPATTQA